MKMFAASLATAVLFLQGAPTLAAEPAVTAAAVSCHTEETLLPAPTRNAHGTLVFVTCEGMTLPTQALDAELLGSACVQVVLPNGVRTWVTVDTVRA